jgi:mRNA-degrading endonuclease toxin of MazEF toxin-antitoxin module
MKARAIWLADFAETATGDVKLRPVLIVSENEFNNGLDVVVLPISHSADVSDPLVVGVTQAEFTKTGLQKMPSSIKWTKPYALPKVLLKKKLGTLSQATFDSVRKKLKSVFTATA